MGNRISYKYEKNRIRKSAGVLAKTIKQHLYFGDIFYLSGSSTKVVVLDCFKHKYPLCRIVHATKHSKYFKYVGQEIFISRMVLYKNQGKGVRV